MKNLLVEVFAIELSAAWFSHLEGNENLLESDADADAVDVVDGLTGDFERI